MAKAAGDPSREAADREVARLRALPGGQEPPRGPEPAPEGDGEPAAASGRQRRAGRQRDRDTLRRDPSGRVRPALERVASAPIAPGVTVDDGAGLLLGLFAWVLTMQYLRGGTPQVKRWLRAKFLNQTGG
jgi:hypothetical protein